MLDLKALTGTKDSHYVSLLIFDEVGDVLVDRTIMGGMPFFPTEGYSSSWRPSSLTQSWIFYPSHRSIWAHQMMMCLGFSWIKIPVIKDEYATNLNLVEVIRVKSGGCLISFHAPDQYQGLVFINAKEGFMKDRHPHLSFMPVSDLLSALETNPDLHQLAVDVIQARLDAADFDVPFFRNYRTKRAIMDLRDHLKLANAEKA